MITRKEFLEKVVEDCLNEMYIQSQPTISLKELIEKYKNGKYDKNPFEYHYLPQKLHKEIIEYYLHVYGIKNKWDDYAQTMIDYLEKGGIKDTWVEDKTSSDGFKYPGYRGYENTPKISDVIGEEAAQKVLELMKTCKEFYKFDKDEINFKFTIFNHSPNLNIERVQELNPNIKIFEKEYDPIDDEWVIVNEETIEKWSNFIKDNDQDDYVVGKITELLDKYKKLKE